jgi:hypothetical protein
MAAGFDSLGRHTLQLQSVVRASAATLFSERFLPRCLAVPTFNAVAIFLVCRVCRDEQDNRRL